IKDFFPLGKTTTSRPRWPASGISYRALRGFNLSTLIAVRSFAMTIRPVSLGCHWGVKRRRLGVSPPCRDTRRKIAEMQRFYEGFPVEIVGACRHVSGRLP